MTNNVDPLAARAAEVEAQGKAIGGEDTWAKGIMPTLERKISSGELSQVELAQKLARPNAASEIFNSNIADADEATWRSWRDSQPRKKARIDGAKR